MLLLPTPIPARKTSCTACIASPRQRSPSTAPIKRCYKQTGCKGMGKKGKEAHSGICVCDEKRSPCRAMMSSVRTVGKCMPNSHARWSVRPRNNHLTRIVLDTTYWKASPEHKSICGQQFYYPTHALLDTKPCDGHWYEHRKCKGKRKGRRTEESLWLLEHLPSDKESAVSTVVRSSGVLTIVGSESGQRAGANVLRQSGPGNRSQYD